MNNKTNELVEALKGLTFKVEIKIVDVVQAATPTVTATTKPTLKLSPAELSSDISSKLPPSHQISSQNSSSNHSLADKPSINEPLPTSKLPLDKPSVDKILQPETSSGKLLTKEPPRCEPAPREPTPIKQVPNKPQFVKPLASKSGLIRGDLKIGSVLRTYCIAVDDRSEPPTAYISYDDKKLMKIAELISDIADDIESQPKVSSVNVGDIVFAKSQDDNLWYRSCVEKVDGENINIVFFDWGLREQLKNDRIRHLMTPDLGLSKYPACALKLTFTNTSKSLLDEVFKCESEFKMRVDSYDENNESYVVTILED